MVLTDVRSLPPRDWAGIESFLEGGGGVAIFLGDNADPEFYNRILQPTSLTPAATQPADAPPMHVHRIELDHPLFSRFSGEARGAILGLNVYRAARIDPGGAVVLATLDNDWPLAVERNPGRGRLIVWATEPVPALTNLPLRRAFIPLMSQLLSYLAGAPPNHVRDENPPRSESSPEMLDPSAIARCAGQWHVTLTSPDQLDAAAILRLPENWLQWWDSLLWLTLAVVLLESLLAIRQSGAGSISRTMAIALYAVRAVALACLAIGLLHVQWQSDAVGAIQPAVAVLLDDSQSMSLGSRFDNAVRIEKQSHVPLKFPKSGLVQRAGRSDRR